VIQTLIDKTDTVELVRDQIAAILAAEVASQKVLAAAADPAKDPRLWDLRVFVDRANPWADYIDAESGELRDALPVVNVSLDSVRFDKGRGSVVDKQGGAATFNVDVYGYGVSSANVSGHLAGDARAKAESLRASRLVRNILMAAEYTYLGMQGLVGRRWIESITLFDIEAEGRTVAHVSAARISIEVELLETSPQVQGVALELISARVERSGTSEVYLTAEYEFGS